MSEILQEPVAYLAQNADGTYDAYHNAHALIDDCRQGFPVYTAADLQKARKEAARLAIERADQVLQSRSDSHFNAYVDNDRSCYWHDKMVETNECIDLVRALADVAGEKGVGNG